MPDYELLHDITHGPASVRVLVDFASEHGTDPARVLSSGDHLLHTEREGVTDLSRLPDAQIRWIKVPVAIPPPQHMVISANSPSLLCSSWMAFVMSPVPVAPSGCPIAIAPPLGLTPAMSGRNSRSHASTTEANASLISTTEMSRICNPLSSRSLLVAGIGPVIIRTAEAPSEIWELVPAVWTASGLPTGFSPARPSSVVSRKHSSRSTTCTSSGRSGSGTRTGSSWESNRPSRWAAARSCESLPKASQSARPIPHFDAIRSAPSNWVVYSRWAR